MKNRFLIFMCILLLGLFLYGCNSSSSSDGAKSSQSQVAQQEDGDDTTLPEEEPPEEPPVEPPIEITGSYTISAMGGASTLGGGGLAGSIEVSACADVSFLKSGTVDAGFVLPTYPIEESLGPYPLVITGAQTVVVDPDSGGPDGLLYMLSGDPNLYISDGDNYLGAGDDNEIIVTGLKVMPGGVLILGLNYDSNDIDEDDDVTTGQDTAALVFTYDVIIQGTVVTAPLASAYMPDSYYPEDRGSLWIQHTYDPHGLYHIAHFVLGPNGVILTAGVDADVQDDRGGDAGDVGIYEFDGCFPDGLIDASGGDGICDGAGGYGGCVDILSFGTMVSTGIIDTSGGDGSNGGDAGCIYLTSYEMLFNTGSMYANGGIGTFNDGGDAGGIYFAALGSIFNSGIINAYGGNAYDDGGDGGEIVFVSGYFDPGMGDIKNSGILNVNGGDGRNGGDAGIIVKQTFGGDIMSAAKLDANGGQSSAGSGGWGGTVIMIVDGAAYSANPPGIEVTNAISVYGGAGTAGGGDGGFIGVYAGSQSDIYPPVDPVKFVDYELIDISGGAGRTSGGDAGYFTLNTGSCESCGSCYPVGAIVNEVDINAVGGDASCGACQYWFGGRGGWVSMDTSCSGEICFCIDGEPNDLVESSNGYCCCYNGNTVVINSGDIDLSGGCGPYGGDSGGLCIYGHDSVENSGTITAMGGDACCDGTYAGIGAYMDIRITSSADLLNTGDVIATGGAGIGLSADGGDVYHIFLWAGGIATNSGSIYANGGDSNELGWNGSGGLADIMSLASDSVNSAPLITVAPGAGGLDGLVGIILVDGVDETPADGTLP